MLYTFLITIVFIAELIILITLIRGLFKLDKIIISINETVDEAKPGIKDIGELTRKISEQCFELSEDFVEKLKLKQEDSVIRTLNKIVIALFLWKINSKVIRQIRRSKLCKLIGKGLNLLQSMV